MPSTKKRSSKDGFRRASRASSIASTSMTSKSPAKDEQHALSRSTSSACQGNDMVVKATNVKNVPDVFAFLEKDEETSDCTSHANGHQDKRSNEAVLPATQLDIDAQNDMLHYVDKSQILENQERPQSPGGMSTVSSVRSGQSGSSFVSHPTHPRALQLRSIEHPLEQHRLAMAESYTPTTSPTVESLHIPQCTFDLSAPESFYAPHSEGIVPHRPPLPPSPPRSPERLIHRRKRSRTSHASSGYALLASQLSSSSPDKEEHLPPLYRRFENVNHRVLLYLQDEIAQMEEDLQALDEYEEMHRVAAAQREGTKTMPASRRMEVQAQVYSSLHYRRLDLMSALTHKTEQYNTALSAYSKVLQTLPAATDKDVEKYRVWMAEKAPIAPAESAFLNHADDLVSLTPRHSGGSSVRALSAHDSDPIYMTIIIASTAILLPLLAFSMISEFAGRLIVVTVVGGASAAVAANYSSSRTDHGLESRDGWRCALVYFGFMTAAAIFIP